MGYSIYEDIDEVNQGEDWTNVGRDILYSSCKHKDGMQKKGYCEKCDISEDSAIPIMNYIYPLELTDFSDNKILKVVKETNCTIIRKDTTDEMFLALCGGGMDLSQDIAYSFVVLETWIPADLLREVNKQPLLSLGSKKYKFLARAIIKQLKIESDRNNQRAKEWKERLKNLKEQEKAKTKQ